MAALTLDTLAEAVTDARWAEPESFEAAAQVAFDHQRTQGTVYGRYCKKKWNGWRAACYLPVEAFKHAPVTTFPPEEAERVFESSGTGWGVPSRHYVRHLELYERVATAHFEAVFGPGPFTFVAHLPDYAARGGRSSLLYMVEALIDRYGDAQSGFFLEDPLLLRTAIAHSAAHGTPLLLFGAAFGLLDLLDAHGGFQLPEDALVIETGGMKTHRREIGRDALHARLADGFELAEDRVRSEYGMCELMSQCYTRGDGVFFPPPWMRFRVVDPEDPRRDVPEGQPGALALFDLANMYTVSALQTQDRAVRVGDGFRVLGRLSRAELRGCNFLVALNGS